MSTLAGVIVTLLAAVVNMFLFKSVEIKLATQPCKKPLCHFIDMVLVRVCTWIVDVYVLLTINRMSKVIGSLHKEMD